MNMLKNVFQLVIILIISCGYCHIFDIYDLDFEDQGRKSKDDYEQDSRQDKKPKQPEQKKQPIQRQKLRPPPYDLPLVSPHKEPFGDFRDRYKREPPFHFLHREDEVYRESIYNKNLQKINRHNEDPYRSFNQQPNQFAIFDEDEFLSIYATLQPSKRRRRVLQTTSMPVKSVDYSYAAGTVRNQGLCGACYAFASVDAIAAQRYVRGCPNKMLLSPQDLVTNSPNFGCAGGSLQTSYDYMQKNGIFYEWAYPYENQYTELPIQSSAFAPFSVAASLFSGRFEISGCENLVDALERSGPLPVGVDAQGMAFYSGGTFSSTGTNINHGVVLLSYDPTKGFYTQNSWGAGWGASGYAWIDVNNNAGICYYAVQFTINSENSENCFNF